MLRRCHALLPVLMLLSLPAIAQAPDVARLDTFFNRLALYQKAMGSIELFKNGKILYQRGFGQAQVGRLTGVDNTPATVYRIGSITKTFTATMIFQLVEAGKLRLEDTLAGWYPQVPNAEKITIDQLLSHRSGLHNITEDTSFMTWQDTVRTKAGVVARIAAGAPDFAPGEKYAYSNTNYMLLGFIIERITGMPYAQALQVRIAGPLKLSKTGLGAKAIRPEVGEALPFTMSNGEWIAEAPSSTEVAGGAGGMVSTVGDMTTFLNALMLRHFLADASLRKMRDIRNSYGRGLMLFPFYEHFAYGHNGQIDDFSSSLALFPKDSLVVCMACNGVNYNFNNILIGVLSICYEKPYTIPDFAKRRTVDAAKLKMLEGVYTYPKIGMDVTITAGATGLTAQATGQGAIELEPISELEFGNDDVGARLIFQQAGDAPASGMTLIQGGSRVPFERKK